jgi:hypothetical protein
MQTLFSPEQRQQSEIVVRPEGADRIPEGADRVNEYARSLLFTVTPPVLELGWALNELRISQQGNQVNEPSLVEESWVPNSGTVAYYLLFWGYSTALGFQAQRDIGMGRVDRALNLNSDAITAITATIVGLRSPSRIIMLPVILPLLGQFVPSENVRNVSRWICLLEFANGAVAGLAARMILPHEDPLQESVQISASLVLGMLGLALLREAYGRTARAP